MLLDLWLMHSLTTCHRMRDILFLPTEEEGQDPLLEKKDSLTNFGNQAGIQDLTNTINHLTLAFMETLSIINFFQLSNETISIIYISRIMKIKIMLSLPCIGINLIYYRIPSFPISFSFLFRWRLIIVWFFYWKNPISFFNLFLKHLPYLIGRKHLFFKVDVIICFFNFFINNMVLAQRSIPLTQHIVTMSLFSKILLLDFQIRRFQNLIISIEFLWMFHNFGIHCKMFIVFGFILRDFFFYYILVLVCNISFPLSSCKFSQESVFKADWRLWFESQMLLIFIFIVLRRIIMKFRWWLH